MNEENDKYIKISFTGDIMCELPLLKSAKGKDGYCFDEVFSKVKPLFSISYYVVGNRSLST